MNKMGAGFVVIVAFFLTVVHGQDTDRTSCSQRNRQIAKTLDPKNLLSIAIEQGAVGDGRDRVWMSTMKELNIKHAAARVFFEIREDKIGMEIKDVKFSSEYYNFVSRVKENGATESNSIRGLKESLKLPFFNKAIEAIQVLGISTGSCGDLYLDLLDDGCLPLRNAVPEVNPNCFKGSLVGDSVELGWRNWGTSWLRPKFN